MDDLTFLRRNTKAVSAEVGDEVIFLHEEEGVYFSLDGVGAFVWRSLVAPRTFGDLVQMVLSEYAVEESDLREDLSQLVEKLAEKGLLES